MVDGLLQHLTSIRTAGKHPLVLFPSDSLSAISTRIFGSSKCSHSTTLSSYISDLLLFWVHRLQGNTYGYQCYITTESRTPNSGSKPILLSIQTTIHPIFMHSRTLQYAISEPAVDPLGNG
jgi:hypothetical protein